ncbi:hypothetical protein LCGC14_1897760, partial [marine sediment metagenome]
MRKWISRLVALLLLIMVAATVIPMVRADLWWVRMFDFPRMQIAAALAVLIVLYAVLAGWRGIVVTLLSLAALGVQLLALWPYQPFAGKMVESAAQCAKEDRLRVLMVNVQRSNEDAQQVMELARDKQPDIFLVLETNERWDRDLAPLGDLFPHKMQAIPKSATYYGMHVYATHPIEDGEFLYPFGVQTPLFVGNIAHPARTVEFLGIHPRPPQRGQPSTMRDAAVLTAARIARESGRVSIAAGDYNATPWEDTTRRALRIGGFLDPRQGRGPLVSFDAKSAWMKWPLDQIVFQPGLGLVEF